MGRAVLQYSQCTCDMAWHCACDTSQALGVGAQGMQAAGGRWADWALQAAGARGARRRACVGVRTGVGQAAWHGRAGRSSGARERGRARRRQARGRQTSARGLGAGRAGWPWAVHSVHSVYFRSVFRLGIFPESPNEHYSLQNKF